ncbi:DUF6383 domain-containing protein [Parabacteroides sp.]|uniref:DUF6383 domain-containing protein n=1 Tax=Parabacteroides sp. TaxID=1869337 RepID=UPI00257D2550|nr:DUF6383 domain-containing protein [Parabacteroides sp.]
MNKKITTLLASAMLATAFSAGAADKGDAVLLKNGDFVTVQTGTGFGKLELKSDVTSKLADLNKATWTVSAKKTVLGKTVYSFVNKATGLMLAVDPATAVMNTATTGPALTLGGSSTEWVNEDGALVSYFKGDSVLYIKKETNGNLFLAKGVLANVAGSLSLDETTLGSVGNLTLKAEDLNTLLQSVEGGKSFGLTMNPEVSKDNENLLTATTLTAEQVGTTDYVHLKAGKDKYVVADTAYYDGTETSKFVKFGYDKLTAAKRKAGSFNFKFSYNVADDELYIQVQEVAHKAVKGSLTDAQWKAYLDAHDNSVWNGTDNTGASNVETDRYIYMARLAGTNVLTVNTATTATGTVGTEQRTVVKLGTNFSGLTLTTIPDGVYTIQYKASKGNSKYNQNGAYALANLAGSFGWAEQAERQDFNHMPAAQWVVKKNGTSNTATVSIANREFSEFTNIVGINAAQILPSNAQFFAVEGSDDVFYFNSGAADTLSFVKVADELVKDAKLGYKYVSVDDAKVQTYTFNYLHGLALDKYLFVEENGVVRVNEKDGKSSFRLEVAVVDDTYGYEDGLVRNVYYVSDGNGKYLTYNADTKKYVLGSEKTPFFLKENNCVDGKHYYALVEAQFMTDIVNPSGDFYDPAGNKLENGKAAYLYTKEGALIVKDYQKDGYKGYFFVKNTDDELEAWLQCDRTTTTPASVDKGSSANYAKVKVSVDDNTLNLTEGNLKDKFVYGENREIRTSAFAVEINDAPLYRRFNNENLGEKEGTINLSFVEKIRKEYLMDEWNEKLQDKTVDYAGIWNKDKAEGKLAFVVDTAWVKRGLGYIKPQYLISVARNDQEGTPGVPCTYEHNHYDNAGNKVDAAHCSHATQGHDGFRYGKYLVSFADSALVDNKLDVPYMDVKGGYTRVGFVEAIHYGDSLIILTGDYEKADPAELNVEEIIAAYKKAKTENLIVNLQGDNHKNVTWSFRYVTPSNDAVTTAEEGTANEFLFESNIYDENGASTSGKATKGFDKAIAGSIAPAHAAWLKMQNGCLVLTRGDSKFEAAKTGSDGALIFNAYQKTEEDDMVTSNDEIAAEGIAIVAGNGTVTIQGAAGKSVVITNILGKVVAETVLTSDNATIAVPAGIVAVAVDGEEAVKAIVK